LIVVVVIIGIFATIIFTTVRHFSGNSEDPGIMFNPDYYNTRANMQQAEEFKRSNDLRERELQIQEQAIELERLKQQNAK
jgi:hypothetical protein